MKKLSEHHLTHIIHVADLHVRVGNAKLARVDEYSHVLRNFVESIATLPCVINGTALMVIAGDVFHSKCRMESAATTVLFDWVNKLLDMLPIVVICGNHDYKQDEPDITDAIKMFITPYQCSTRKYAIHYLDETSHYTWGNIGIGLVHVKDTLRAFNTSGVVSELPEFPSPKEFPTELQRTVALFHGTISSSYLPSGRPAESVTKGYPLEWFNGYDFVLLGDNHKQQLHEKDGMIWGYPGSLVQQDFGEPVYGHGYFLWDIQDRAASVHHIRNDYGALTLYEDTHQVSVTPGTTLLLADAVKSELIPKYPRVRVIGDKNDVSDVMSTFAEYNIIPSDVIFRPKCGAPTNTHNNDTPIDDSFTTLSHLNNTDTWNMYLKANGGTDDMSVFIQDINNMLLVENGDMPHIISDAIHKRNAVINGLIRGYEDTSQIHSVARYNISLKYMQWDNLMCFGTNNYFDFESLTHKIGLLNGANASGKSSFLDVLCIAIYGRPTSSRNEFTGSNMTVKIINDFRGSYATCGVTLLVCINQETFEIHRTFSSYGDDARSNNIKPHITVVYKHQDQDRGKVVVAEGATTVDKWIQNRFGTSDEILMSTILCQSDTTNFFFKKKTEQRDILEKALNMDSITAYVKVLDETVKAHKYVIEKLQTYISGLSVDFNETENIGILNQNEVSQYTEQQIQIQANVQALKDAIEIELRKIGDFTYERLVEQPEVTMEKSKIQLTAFEGVADCDKEELIQRKGMLQSRYDELKYIDGNVQSNDELQRLLDKHIKMRPHNTFEMSDAYIVQKRSEHAEWITSMHAVSKLKESKVMKLLAAVETRLEILRKLNICKPDTDKCNDETYESSMSITDLYNEWEHKRNQLREHHNNMPNVVNIESYDNQDDICLDNFDSSWIANPSDVHRIIAELQTHVLSINSKLEQEHTATFVPLPTMARHQNHTPASCEVSLIELQTPIIPSRSLDDHPVWLRMHAKWKSFLAKLPEETTCALQKRRKVLVKYLTAVQDKRNELDELVANIANMESVKADIEQIEFNPSCNACCKQPKYLHLQMISGELVQHHKQITKLRTYLDKHDIATYETELTMLDNKLNIRLEYEEKNQTMIDDEIMWSSIVEQHMKEQDRQSMLSQVWWTMRDEWEARVNILRGDKVKTSFELGKTHEFVSVYAKHVEYIKNKDAISVYSDWKNTKNTLDNEYIKAHIILWREWSKQIQDLETQHRMHTETLILLRDYKQQQSKWNTELANLDNAQQFNDWNDEYIRLRDLIAWNTVRSEYNTVSNQLNAIRTRDQLLHVVRLCEQSIAYGKHQQLTVDIDDAHGKLDKIVSELSRYHEYMSVKNKRDMASASLHNTLSQMKKRLELLTQFTTLFVGDKKTDGFKHWVYRSMVVPLIENEVNNFIKHLEDFRLKILVRNDNFIYMLEDRGSKPTLDHASGYQKFVVGLGMRVALSRIGAVGQNIKHMFIDEGFAACDAVNIQKTKDIIELLATLGGYKSILLISHLDVIRDIADIRIDIGRDTNTSHIRFGNQLHATPKITKTDDGEIVPAKKGGRPTKAAMIAAAKRLAQADNMGV